MSCADFFSLSLFFFPIFLVQQKVGFYIEWEIGDGEKSIKCRIFANDKCLMSTHFIELFTYGSCLHWIRAFHCWKLLLKICSTIKRIETMYYLYLSVSSNKTTKNYKKDRKLRRFGLQTSKFNYYYYNRVGIRTRFWLCQVSIDPHIYQIRLWPK
jgi:hypothetical protein